MVLFETGPVPIRDRGKILALEYLFAEGYGSLSHEQQQRKFEVRSEKK